MLIQDRHQNRLDPVRHHLLGKVQMTTWTATPSDAHIERAVITGMVISDRALRVIGLAYKPQYLTAEFSREVAKWCLLYQEKYNRAPGPDIQTLYESQRRNGLDPELARLISHFLTSIADEFNRQEQYNEQLAIDEALKYFRERSLRILRDDLDYYLDAGNVHQAHAAVADFHSVENSINLGFEPLTDMDGIRDAFEQDDGILILPGAFGRMLGPLEREWLLMVVGRYKSTKSWTCQHIVQQALYARLNVAWFDLELGERRLRKRFAQGFCAMPIRPPKNGSIIVPVWDCRENQSGECSRVERENRITLLVPGKDGGEAKKPAYDKAPLGYRPCCNCTSCSAETWFETRQVTALDWRIAWHKAQAIAGAVMGARLKVQCWPKFSAGVDDVKATLQIWQHLDNFVPDVVVVDQPDIMRMDARGDYRHKVDDLWKRLGAIAQERHCLLLAPSQAGGKIAQERKRLLDSDVAEDSRKLGHVDGSIKIDQSEEDEVAKRAWFSMGVVRDDAPGNRYCLVLQCLDLGQPIMDSRLV